MVCGNKGVLEELRFIYLTFKQAKKDMFCLFQIHVFFVVRFGILHKSSITLPKQEPTSPAMQRFLKCMEEEISGLLKTTP
ncbi:hypothetical protein B7722_00680 [Streptococcus oralis subsp. oralis]|uniref:Uncharacterized protein n=1 Tax=Streptococcus oralis subsp. oralis TaxID=1891914 RepID=A0A1X1H0J0_STROR|nr:hypothetical protein B7722_00680 [Streptococcus oralis subsp. oralis]